MEAKFQDIPNELWDLVQPILPPELPYFKGGRPPIERRRILAGIVYRLRTGYGQTRGATRTATSRTREVPPEPQRPITISM